jgi:type IV secretion system protein VirD4
MAWDKESRQFKFIVNGVLAFIAMVLFFSFGSIAFLTVMGLPLEQVMPWTAYVYWDQYGELPQVKQSLLTAHAGAGIVVFLCAVVFFKPKPLSLFGEAQWAKETDLARAEPSLRASKGILVGQFNGRYLIQGGQQFTIMAAPTRGMKGVAVVIPNCLNWHGSLVCTDIKLENYRITSGFRKESGQDVFLFNPSPKDYKTHRWNPLSYISTNTHFRIDDIQKITHFLIPTPRGVDPMWSSAGRSLLLGLILYLLDQDEFPVTLGEVYRQLSTEKESSEYFKALLDTHGKDLDPLCVMNLGKFVNLPAKQREGVKSTVETAIDLWANPLLDAATATNDFDFRDLRKKRMSIYVGITPDNLARFAPVLNLFFQQLVDQNTQHLPDPKKEPHSVLLLMDEFPALGKMETIETGVSYMAGYNLRLLPIIQSPAQLVSIYGKEAADNFIENHATRVVFAPKKMKEAADIANELGNMTVKSTSISKPRDMGKGMGNRTESDTKRPLLLPQEVKDIGTRGALILSENCPPVKAKKIVYYEDDNFIKRCIPKENRAAARKSKSQDEFMQLVKTPADIPTIVVIPHVVRGLKDRGFELNFDAVPLPGTKNQPLTEEQIATAADDFMAMLESDV